MIITSSNGIDTICVNSAKEGLTLLKNCELFISDDPEELVRGISISGLSLRDAVTVYSAFMREHGKNVIEFSDLPNGKKRKVQLYREVA